MKKIGRGKPLEELVKGSLEHTLWVIEDAFNAQFNMHDGSYAGYVMETFADHVIVRNHNLATSEYYYVPYTKDGESYIFAAREAWEVVELSYAPAQKHESLKKHGKRFVERVCDGRVTLLEATGDGGLRRIRAVGITADVVNGNGRRYPAAVLRAAVEDLKTHLHESAGQGRAMQLLGEAEHPSDKVTGRQNLTETVVKWKDIQFDGSQVLLEGVILETAKGKDILALLEGGVVPDVSQRAYGEAVVVEERGQRIEEVKTLMITGYDLVLDGSDPHAGVTMFESQDDITEGEMNLEELRKKYPDLVKQIEEERDATVRAQKERELNERAQNDAERERIKAQYDKELRESLGIGESDDLAKAIEANNKRLQELEAQRVAREVQAYLEVQAKELKYSDFLAKQFVEAMKNAAPQTMDEAKRVFNEKRTEYDAIQSELVLRSRGFGGAGVLVTGPVLERETGVPAFARAGYMIQESLMQSPEARRWVMTQPKSLNEEYAANYLRLFDERFKQQLMAESRIFQEAEQASDLSLPYSVTRAVIAEALPELVASGIFDFGMMANSTDKLYYETYAGETGATGTVTDEEVVADEDAWVELGYKRITPGTVVVTTDPSGTTYDEADDYVIDYANGKIMCLSTGDISDADELLVDYSYSAIRKGEMVSIERGKMTLATATITAAADRLATQISEEAIQFSLSQLGYDAQSRTLLALVKQIQRKIDLGIFYLALASVTSVASNSGGTYTSGTTTLDNFVKYIGLAKVKVAERYYAPTAILGSISTIDDLSNWDGFKRDGFPDAVMNSNGFAGRVKGLPVFNSTEMSDSYLLVVNRELVMHRVYSPMRIKGPFPSYDASTGEMIAAEQYYAEEFNATEAPVANKGAYVKIA